MPKIIGIDLGTSNSAASAMMGGRPTIIPSAEGQTLGGKAFPSVVAFSKEGDMLVGEPARRQAISNPDCTITAIKRKMGTDYKVDIRGTKYSPQQISAFLLQKIRRDAEAFLGEKVEKAVITVPAYFNDNQRQATKDAGEIAGLEVVRIINEPTAASLAYGLDKSEKELKIMVFDFGGGTLDVTIMEFGGGVFEVKSTSGDTNLGGTDMDTALFNYIVDEFKKESGIDLSQDKVASQRVKEEAEKAKIELSTVPNRDINLPYVTADASGPKHLNMTLTRAKLEELVSPIVEKCKHSIIQTLSDAKLSSSDIAKVILVGGPTRMPIVRKFVQEVVGQEPELGVDSMECVAMGAAIQGGVLAGEVKDILLLDVTPLSLGVETLGGVLTKLIERNTTIPTKKTETFSTAADSQTAVTINVLQGERSMASDNISLGTFNLENIPPAPRGVPKIEVSFDIDANGILNVSAKDIATNKEQKITITASTKLSDDEKERMVQDAERFAEEDKKRKDQIDLLNTADTLIYTAEKTKSDLQDKMSDEQKSTLDKSITDLKETVAAKNLEVIKTKSDELSKVLQDVGAAIYQQEAQQQASQQAAQQASQKETPNETKKEEGNVVDADYKVVDEDKNKVVDEDKKS